MRRLLIHVQYLKGIGHLARAGLIAEAAARRGMDVHIASGGLPLSHFAPESVTLHQLAPLQAGAGGFSDLRDGQGKAIDDAWRSIRREETLALFGKLASDVLVIESFPFGRRALGFELIPLLEAARSGSHRPAVICSIRDILQENRKPGRAAETLSRLRQYFDAVLVHGDERFAALHESFPKTSEIPDMLTYTGFVTPSNRMPESNAPRGEVVVSAGGGAVGPLLAQAALEARQATALKDEPWRIITGPNLPEDDFAKLCRDAGESVTVERFRSDFRTLLAGAKASISYAGYNTVCDLMQARVPSVLVTYGGQAGEETEQPARAARCEALGLGVALADSAVNPASLANALARAIALPRTALSPFNMDGAERSAECLARWSGGAISGRSA